MPSLYEIDQMLLACIDPETGEIIDDEQLTALQMERDAKIEGVALWIKNLKAEAEAYKAEKDAFAAREKAAKDKAESLRKWLAEALAGQAFKSPKAVITWRKSSAVVVDDLWKVDESFLKYKEPDVDRIAIAKAIKEGAEVSGVHIEERQSMTIK